MSVRLKVVSLTQNVGITNDFNNKKIVGLNLKTLPLSPSLEKRGGIRHYSNHINISFNDTLSTGIINIATIICILLPFSF